MNETNRPSFPYLLVAVVCVIKQAINQEWVCEWKASIKV